MGAARARGVSVVHQPPGGGSGGVVAVGRAVALKAFGVRVEKSDLGLRPVYHQKTARVQAHILVCFLALALWRTLEQWMASKGLGTCARPLLKELEELHSMDVVLPTDTGVELRLRVVAQPEKELAQLLAHL